MGKLVLAWHGRAAPMVGGTLAVEAGGSESELGLHETVFQTAAPAPTPPAPAPPPPRELDPAPLAWESSDDPQVAELKV